jgi:RNA-splicing ligase RtcB
MFMSKKYFFLPIFIKTGTTSQVFFIFDLQTPEQGAIPIVHACVSPRLEGRGGTYIHNCRIFSTSDNAKSADLQEKLFDFTKDLLKIEEFGRPHENNNQKD